MRLRLLPLLIAVGAIVCTQFAGAQIAVFDFDSLPSNTITTFSDTKSGLTATFSSPADPGGFGVAPSFFSPPMTGNVLLDPSAAAANNLPLTISFDHVVDAVALDFALNTNDIAVGITIDAFLSGSPVGSTFATGAIPGGFAFPQGSIAFSSTPFDSIRVSSTALDLAVDNVTARGFTTGSNVPEPGAFALLTGLAIPGAMLWRRRK